jgi:small membrane protein
VIIRIILLGGLAAIGYLGFVRRNRLPVNIMLVFAILGVAALAVLFPQRTDVIANWIGVGTGADLIGYLVQTLLLFVSLHYYTKFVDVQRQITQLTRELALLRAERDRED